MKVKYGLISSQINQLLKTGRSTYGKGKGSLDHWVAVVKPGRILFEIEGVSKQVAEESLQLAAQKLPVLTKFIVRRDYDAAN